MNGVISAQAIALGKLPGGAGEHPVDADHAQIRVEIVNQAD